MPEDLPTPKKSLKQLEKENKKNLKNGKIKSKTMSIVFRDDNIWKI